MGCTSSGPLMSDGAGPPPASGQTRILQEEVVDRCVGRPPPQEPRPLLATGRFIDGMLGLCDRDLFLRMLAALPLGQLFEDEDFPAEEATVSFSCPEACSDVVWMRPCDLCDAPYLFVDGTSRVDVKQGSLGDCWFLSACAAVAKRQDLIEKVIDPTQRLFGDGYHGALLVNFWRFGEWVTVHIDDRLPTRDGRLLYASCTDPNEFWLAVVEKAFAKLHGSYEALSGGHALEAFVDLTGGIAERIHTSYDMFKQLKSVFLQGAFITCSRKTGRPVTTGSGQGLIQGHAYTVTSLATVALLSGRSVSLVRVRNPWGDAVEWQGTWSDRSDNWEAVTEEDKQRLRVTALDDGEFWMEYEDFREQFQDVTVATLGPDFDQDGQSDTPRQASVVKSSWTAGKNAGGSRNDLERFSTNPQFRLTLTEADGAEGEMGRCSVIVALMQEHRRSEKHAELAMLPIGIFIYKTESPGERLGAEYFLCVPEAATAGDFTDAREVFVRTHLEPGDFVVIPATFQPDCETNFMLRVFALKPFALAELP